MTNNSRNSSLQNNTIIVNRNINKIEIELHSNQINNDRSEIDSQCNDV